MDILRRVSLLLITAQLFASNLKVLSDAAWYIFSDPDQKSRRSSPSSAKFASHKSVLQPVLSRAFELWLVPPTIATITDLYVADIVRLCHTVHREKQFDTADVQFEHKVLYPRPLRRVH